MVAVRIPNVLRTYSGWQEITDLDASTIGDVLRSLASADPGGGAALLDEAGTIGTHLVVYCDGLPVVRDDWDTMQVSSSDQITLLVPISGGAEDVRMRGFRERATVERALEAALERVVPLPAEEVSITECASRVLAADVVSEVDVPPFRRATMDGFAVRADDTYGASSYDPVVLNLIGPSMPGRAQGGPIATGSAGPIMTGAPVPQGADAVLRAEDASVKDGRLEVAAPVASEKNIGRVAEDVEAGTTVLTRGRRLLPQDAGLLASIGVDPVPVHRRPVVRIVVSGDELLSPGERPDGFRIVDSNSPMLAALVSRDGGTPQIVRLPDDEQEMRRALTLPGADIVVTSGAASVGIEDRVPVLVAELGDLLVHGVAMRPSSPAGVGRIGDAPVILLPGNPVSCLVAYDFFAGPVVRVMGGRDASWSYRSISLPLGKRLVSQIGRTDYARVSIVDGEALPVAISGASVLSSVTRASGFVVVPAGLEGYGEGTNVIVHLYEPDGWT